MAVQPGKLKQVKLFFEPITAKFPQNYFNSIDNNKGYKDKNIYMFNGLKFD